MISFVFLFSIILGEKLFHEKQVRSKKRILKRRSEKIIDGTHRCIKPQELGSFVVFPVCIESRNADRDHIVVLTDNNLVVQLAQGGFVMQCLKKSDGKRDSERE